MRVTLLGLLLAACGCASLVDHLTHAGTAVGLGLTAATVAMFGGPIGGSPVMSGPQAGGEAEVTITTETTAPAPAPASTYQTWIAARTACANAREYHVRCVRAQGQACFFETDDGFAYDCADADCKSVPPELAAWCGASAKR